MNSSWVEVSPRPAVPLIRVVSSSIKQQLVPLPAVPIRSSRTRGDCFLRGDSYHADCGMDGSLKQVSRRGVDEVVVGTAQDSESRIMSWALTPASFADRFDVMEKIGSGSFGDVKRGIDKVTGKEIAIKTEKKEEGTSVAREVYLYRKLDLAVGSEAKKSIPALIFSGIVGSKYVIVMEMLGPNLEKLFNLCNRHFTLKTVSQIAIQLLERIEFIHSQGILHRDIKPENFVIGKRDVYDAKMRNRLHIVDFGLSKCYVNEETGAHNPPLTGKELTGTARYVSLRTHNGEEQSRRDDIEAIGHMLIYFMRGSLPWQGLKAEAQPGLDTRAANKLRYKMIEERKRSISIQELCAGIPWEFERFLSYSRYVMGYMDEPDYDYLRQLFSTLREQHGYPDDDLYDWDCLGQQSQQNMEEGYQSLSNIKISCDVQSRSDIFNTDRSNPFPSPNSERIKVTIRYLFQHCWVTDRDTPLKQRQGRSIWYKLVPFLGVNKTGYENSSHEEMWKEARQKSETTITYTFKRRKSS